jgi:flagellar biosynthesis protein FlhB
MSDEQGEDKTEAPSGRRLEQAYREGNVPVGRDIIQAASFAAGAVALVSMGAGLEHALVDLVWTSLTRVAEGRPQDLLPRAVRPATIVATVCAAVGFTAVVAVLAQTRLGFWPDHALPKFDRVFSAGKMGRLFKKETLADLGMNLVKIVALGGTIWLCIRDEFVTLPRFLHLGADGLLSAMFAPLANSLAIVLTVLLFLAGADLALTQLRFRGKLKMTKEELKREYKEEEGDPIFRSRRRRQHRDLVKGRINVEVPRADVVVVNPTHIAIVLRYRPDEDRAPRVTAKGKGEQAENIRALAREHGIPIVENVPLARLLFRRVKVGRTVPAETFKAVAAVLAFVYRTLGRNGAGQSNQGVSL